MTAPVQLGKSRIVQHLLGGRNVSQTLSRGYRVNERDINFHDPDLREMEPTLWPLCHLTDVTKISRVPSEYS